MSRSLLDSDDRGQKLLIEIEEQASLYALGLLDAQTASALDTLVKAGCPQVAAALERAGSAVLALSIGAEPVAPPQQLRKRLVERIAASATPNPVSILKSDAFDWQPAGMPGVWEAIVFRDTRNGLETSLVKMEPGSRVTPHSHSQVEQCLVLEGDVTWGGEQCKTGDFLVGPGGRWLPEMSTVGGNLLLIVGSPDAKR
ncbi:MAG: cupin domain-containing protein [Bryobacteraceae bacterium]|nr:cupin domain-containing protein [Bryobacteraceae bacterium]